MKFILKILLIFFVSCSSQPRHVQLAHGAISSFSKKMYTKGFFLFGSGGSFNKDIKIFGMSFKTYKNVNLAEARTIFVNMAENFLNLANIDSEIRLYLHDYPLSINNLSLSINFDDLKNDWVHSPSIAYVSIPNMDPRKPTNLIFYSIYNSETDSLETVHRETYEEAFNIVKSQNGLQFY